MNGKADIFLVRTFTQLTKRCFVEVCHTRNDGFMFIGGTIDLPPETYGEEPTTETLYIQDQRARFDLELMRRALRTKKPILGICAGAQLLNVVRGGTLHQHIPDAYKESEIEHFQFTFLLSQLIIHS